MSEQSNGVPMILLAKHHRPVFIGGIEAPDGNRIEIFRAGGLVTLRFGKAGAKTLDATLSPKMAVAIATHLMRAAGG